MLEVNPLVQVISAGEKKKSLKVAAQSVAGIKVIFQFLSHTMNTLHVCN